MTAADGLALQRPDVVNTRPASGPNGIHLDERLQRARLYNRWRRVLEVITGVRGAGRSRLISTSTRSSEVATAYHDAGYNVRSGSSSTKCRPWGSRRCRATAQTARTRRRGGHRARFRARERHADETRIA